MGVNGRVNWSELGATAGGQTLVLLTGAAKINDFRSKLEFRSRFRKLDVILCAQAWQFRHMFEKLVFLTDFTKLSKIIVPVHKNGPPQNC